MSNTPAAGVKSGSVYGPAAMPSVAKVGGNFRVAIRIRPPLPREINNNYTKITHIENETLIVSENLEGFLERTGDDDGLYATHQFTFDKIFDLETPQQNVYEETSRELVHSVLSGYNASVIAYGQTGTGKTYTMEGGDNPDHFGIIPRSITEVFKSIQSCKEKGVKFLVRASYLQIYNEVISDMLRDKTNLQIREDKKRGVYCEGLSEWVVRNPKEIMALMQWGASQRATGTTRLNELSSRSHAVFVIIVEQSSAIEGAPDDQKREAVKIGKLYLVDLAGSERLRLSGAVGRRLEESKKINQSLSCLGNVIAALTDSKPRTHIPYRDSKLTRLLEDSLGGNCLTTMIATISPALESFAETISTLKFANRAKNIQNKPRVNEEMDQKKYEVELQKLRGELAARETNVFDKRKMLELEQQTRQAEQDKLAAIRALERASEEFIQEKRKKEELEKRINDLQSQLLDGSPTSDNDDNNVKSRASVKAEQVKVQQQYLSRVSELERERKNLQEDKAQVDRYKTLLLKQRDIMIALTARLNERDETIFALQEELDAYDRHTKVMQDMLDQKTAELIHLQRVVLEANVSSPIRNSHVDQALGVWGGAEGSNSNLKNVKIDRAPGPLFAVHSVTDKIYPPFGVEVERASSLLSAEDKIAELEAMLEESMRRASSLAKAGDDLVVEKASLERLLEERVGGLVAERLGVDDEEKVQLEEKNKQLNEANVALVKKLKTVQAKEQAFEKLEQKLTSLENERQTLQQKLNAISALRSNIPSKRVDDMSFEQAEASVITKRPSDTDDLKQRVDYLQDVKKELSNKIVERDRKIMELTEENVKLKQTSPSANIQQLKDEIVALTNENATLKSHRVYAREINALRQQCLRYASEHAAMRAILENKLKVLVDALATYISTPADQQQIPPTALQKQVRQLQKLVDASINALQSPKDDPNNASMGESNNMLTSMVERRKKESTKNDA